MAAGDWTTPSEHPVAAGLGAMHRVVDDLVGMGVGACPPASLASMLVDVTRLQAKLTELTGRVAVAADRAGVGEDAGATSTAAWWAHATAQTRPATARLVRLGRALDRPDHDQVRDALAAGDLVADQAVVIIEAVDNLPDDLVNPATRRKAEAHLVGLAADHHAEDLRRLGRHLLEVAAPEAAEEWLARQLEDEEARTREAARLTMSDDGHGRTHGRFTLPTAQAQMLRKHLMALAAPRRHSPGLDDTPDAERKPLPRRLGEAFVEYVERYPADRTPEAGGVAATVVVTMPLETLLGGHKPATLDTGAEISGALARRFACEAGIIPAVLGGRSQVLDLGRERRFHNKAQRITLALEQGGCTADGCDWPPGMCHAHHDTPWHVGGHTNTATGRLLCPRHHARAHDPAYTMSKLPGGKVSFTRRT